jgi:hypothetical protein
MFVTFPLLFEGGVARTDVNCLIISLYRAEVGDWIADFRFGFAELAFGSVRI